MEYFLIFVAINFLIVLHEAGHLIGAKCAGIGVARFSVGFGRKIWGLKIRDTEYRFSMIPLGGYVLPSAAGKERLDRLSTGRRMIFSLGGPLANLVGAFVCIALASTLRGGFSLKTTFLLPLTLTWQTVSELCTLIPAAFGNPQQVSGIVGLVAIGGQNVGASIGGLLIFAFILNVNLFVLNLLPIPPLDGGRIVFLLLQRLYAPLQRLRIPIALTGWVLLVGVLVYATAMDISRLLAQAP